MADTTLKAKPETHSQAAPSFVKRYFQNRRSLVPVPVALALSLTLVYLAAGNFDPSDLVVAESDASVIQAAQEEPCVANEEKSGSSHDASGDAASLPCQNSKASAESAAPESIESWAYLWPRLKTRPPRS